MALMVHNSDTNAAKCALVSNLETDKSDKKVTAKPYGAAKTYHTDIMS